MSRVWFSGFETGDFSEKSFGPFGAGAASVQSSVVRSGAYAAKLTGNKFYGFGNFSLSTIYYRACVYISALPAAGCQLLSTADAGALDDVVSVLLTSAGKFSCYYNNYGTLYGTGTAVITPGVWALVELKVVIGAGSGIVELRVNGIVDQTYTGLTNNALGNIVAVVTVTSDPAVDIYFDDLAVDDTIYPGPGKVVARQGTVGTPTYDTWTKNGAATAALCWSDTPCNTATNCSDSVLADKQTMLVWGFNGYQTGHGLNTIGPNDTINAAKVSVIAKAASAGNMDILLRYGGTDHATTVSLGTSDGYFESAFYTPTPSQLNAAEIGVDNDLTAILTTAEDCWLQVDYTPGVSTPTAPGFATRIGQNSINAWARNRIDTSSAGGKLLRKVLSFVNRP